MILYQNCHKIREKYYERAGQTITTNQYNQRYFYHIAGTLEYIASVFSKNFADSMNMRTFSGRICEIARESLRTALKEAKKWANVVK